MLVELDSIRKNLELSTMQLASFGRRAKTFRGRFSKFIGDILNHHQKDVDIIEAQMERISGMIAEIESK
jgi:hypothetical protein